MPERNEIIESLNAQITALVCGQSSDLNDVVRRLFEFQYEHCSAYRRICEQRQVNRVTGWQDVPAIHVDTFKHMDVRCFNASQAVAEFCTSGTTTGKRGRHIFDDLGLYRLASMSSFKKTFLADRKRIQIVSLIPGISDAPDSSLSQMISWAIEDFGTDNSIIDPTGAVLENVNDTVLILGTAIALAKLFEGTPNLKLPPGTRIMETGGFKGRRRELSRTELFELYTRAGVDVSCVVGEYGMTELSSQWYDGVAGNADLSPEKRLYRPPPWARTRVVDPNTLNVVQYGEIGLLLHVDPVNRASVQAVLTSDLGERCQSPNGEPDAFRYLGRATGAEVRGCSLRSDS